MKLLVTNNTAANITFDHLGGYVLPANAENVDLLLVGDGYTLQDIYLTDYLRQLYDSGDVSVWFENLYRIESDCSIGQFFKDPLSYNYKTELLNGYWYTPIYTIHKEGESVGTLEKTEYYRNYVNENDKGDLVLCVDESYVIDDSDTSIVFSARPAISRQKVWKLAKLDGTLETIKIKQKTKLYNTRRKSHEEGIRRRKNIEEQLIDNVALAGILSAVFADENDAYDKLVELQEAHENAFASWINSGRGSLYDDITNDTTHTWLTSTIADNENTQAECDWMIGLTFKSYIVEKLKGNIK